MGPEIPRWALMALGFLFGTLALLAMSLLVRDALGLVVLTFSRRAGGFILGNGWLTFALIVTCTGLALAGVREAVSAPRVRQVEVVLPGLAAEFEGYRRFTSAISSQPPPDPVWLDESFGPSTPNVRMRF